MTVGYRQLALPAVLTGDSRRVPLIVEATLRFRQDDPKRLRRRAERIMRDRVAAQPTWQPSAGCFFRNPAGQRPAGWLIEAAGLKGVSVGDACVSERHANFIVNAGHATAAEVLTLKARIESTVWEHFQVRLEPEVKIIGQEKDT